MAASKKKGTKKASTPKAAARSKPVPPPVAPLQKEKVTVLYPRLGFEEVGNEVGATWGDSPDTLRLQRATPQQLQKLIQQATELKAPEAEAHKKYVLALTEYNHAHETRRVALDAAWRMFLYVNEQSKTEAKYDPAVAEMFKPMHDFMAAPAAKGKRTKKRAKKNPTV